MNTLLEKNHYFVKQILEVKKFIWLSPAMNYQIFDEENGTVIMETSEPPLGLFTKMCRIDKRYRGNTPFDITIKDVDGQTLVRIKRGISFMHSNVEVFGAKGETLGRIKQTFSPINAKFDVLDNAGKLLANIKGDWAAWDFKIVAAGAEVATICKNANEGIVTMLFRDSYDVRIAASVPADSPLRAFVLAASVCIDIACNE